MQSDIRLYGKSLFKAEGELKKMRKMEKRGKEEGKNGFRKRRESRKMKQGRFN